MTREGQPDLGALIEERHGSIRPEDLAAELGRPPHDEAPGYNEEQSGTEIK